MRKLDIIVAHYNEPWEIGEPFFRMLDLQLGINFHDIRVILVHDGSEPFPEEYFAGYRYTIVQHRIPHGGISVARNAGIQKADAEWISFSDFDDTYSGVLSVKSVMDIICSDKGNGFDMIVAPFIGEDLCTDGTLEYRPVKNNDMVFIHGKYYRLDAIRLNDLKFDPELNFNEDGLFNMLFSSLVGRNRIGGLDTGAYGPIYIWRYRSDSTTATPGRRCAVSACLYYRNRKVTDSFEKRMPHDEFVDIAIRTMMDAYYVLQHEHIEEYEGYEKLCRDIDDFFVHHYGLLSEISMNSFQEIRKATEGEYEKNDSEIHRRLCKLVANAVLLKKDRPGFWEWVDQMKQRLVLDQEVIDQ